MTTEEMIELDNSRRAHREKIEGKLDSSLHSLVRRVSIAICQSEGCDPWKIIDVGTGYVHLYEYEMRRAYAAVHVMFGSDNLPEEIPDVMKTRVYEVPR